MENAISPRSGSPTRNGCLQWIFDHAQIEQRDCLIWPFAKDENGRGSIRVSGESIGVHRYMCIVAHGMPPVDKPWALHSCGNNHEGCVNPSHLYWGTPAENSDDTMRHGPRRIGGRTVKILTDEQVAQIRTMDARQVDIAVRFGITQAQVSFIKNGKRRKVK